MRWFEKRASTHSRLPCEWMRGESRIETIALAMANASLATAGSRADSISLRPHSDASLLSAHDEGGAPPTVKLTPSSEAHAGQSKTSPNEGKPAAREAEQMTRTHE